MAKKPLLSPKNDVVFKMIFADKNNNDILVDFLQSIIDLPPEEYASLEVVNPNLRPEDEEDKRSVLDLKLQTTSGNVIDIEIQLCNNAWMKERIVYYTAKMLTEQISAGDRYDKIKKVITILIADFTLIKDSNSYKNQYVLRTADGAIFSDIMEIVLLQLTQIPNVSDLSKLYDWLQFLKTKRVEELMELAERNPKIHKALGILERLSEDDETRMLAEAREKMRRDIDSMVYSGRMEGQDYIIKLMEQGLSIEEIKLRTGR